jgi:hypothetical protein
VSGSKIESTERLEAAEEEEEEHAVVKISVSVLAAFLFSAVCETCDCGPVKISVSLFVFSVAGVATGFVSLSEIASGGVSASGSGDELGDGTFVLSADVSADEAEDAAAADVVVVSGGGVEEDDETEEEEDVDADEAEEETGARVASSVSRGARAISFFVVCTGDSASLLALLGPLSCTRCVDMPV